jgi:1-phosphatidylinositol phosphodiesterase
MLGDGIRVFDLRIGALPGGMRVGFFHGPPILRSLSLWYSRFYAGPALLSDTVEVEDVFFGFYKFLMDNPSETLLLSVKVDNTTFEDSETKLHETIHALVTQGVGRDFWLQADGHVRCKKVFA